MEVTTGLEEMLELGRMIGWDPPWGITGAVLGAVIYLPTRHARPTGAGLLTRHHECVEAWTEYEGYQDATFLSSSTVWGTRCQTHSCARARLQNRLSERLMTRVTARNDVHMIHRLPERKARGINMPGQGCGSIPSSYE